MKRWLGIALLLTAALVMSCDKSAVPTMVRTSGVGDDYFEYQGMFLNKGGWTFTNCGLEAHDYDSALRQYDSLEPLAVLVVAIPDTATNPYLFAGNTEDGGTGTVDLYLTSAANDTIAHISKVFDTHFDTTFDVGGEARPAYATLVLGCVSTTCLHDEYWFYSTGEIPPPPPNHDTIWKLDAVELPRRYSAYYNDLRLWGAESLRLSFEAVGHVRGYLSFQGGTVLAFNAGRGGLFSQDFAVPSGAGDVTLILRQVGGKPASVRNGLLVKVE